MLLALLGAFAAALCYGVGTVLQAVSARREAVGSGLDPRLLVRLLRQGPYLAGLLLDLVGFAASVFALRSLPLFLVQSAVASSVGVTTLLAVRVFGIRLGRPEAMALAGVGLGLGLLAVSAQPEQAHPLSPAGRWLLPAALLGLALVSAGLSRGTGPRRAAVVAAAAGFAFAGAGIAARVLVLGDRWWGVLANPVGWSLLGFGVLGTLLFAIALQRGSAVSTAAVTFAVETVVPAAVGLIALGDRARSGFAGPAALGFVLTVLGAIALARYAEPGDAPAPGPTAPPPATAGGDPAAPRRAIT